MRLPASRVLADIRKGKLASGYLLLGKDLYWRDQIWRALRSVVGLDGASTGVADFDLHQDSLEAVLERARMQSLWTSRQLLLVRNAQGGSARGRRGSEQSSNLLTAYFRNPDPSTILLLEMNDVDLESEDWREKEKVKSRLLTYESMCDVVLLSSPSFEEALELVRRHAAEWGRKISSQAAEQLVTAFDRNMSRIQSELQKLCLYHAEKTQLETEDMNLLLGGLPGHSDLPLTEAIGSGDPEKALAVLAEVLRWGKYPPLVLSEVARYLRQLILIQESRAGDVRIASKVLWEAKLPAPQRLVQGFFRQAGRFPRQVLVHGLKRAYEADLALRSTPPSERLILEMFVLELMEAARFEGATRSTEGRSGGKHAGWDKVRIS